MPDLFFKTQLAGRSTLGFSLLLVSFLLAEGEVFCGFRAIVPGRAETAVFGLAEIGRCVETADLALKRAGVALFGARIAHELRAIVMRC